MKVPKSVTAIALGLSIYGGVTVTEYSGKVHQTLSSSSKKSDDIFGQIEKLSENAEGLYGFKIQIDHGGNGMYGGFRGDSWDSVEQLESLKSFLDILRIYPEDFVKNAFIREVFLMKNLRDSSGKELGGYHLKGGKLFVNVSGGNIHKFHHELFHRLDNNDGNNDDQIWEKMNSNSRPPINHVNNPSYLMGYADDYGATEGTNEDQATIVEYLFDPEVRALLLERAKSDDILRKKIMLITGCFYDTGLGLFSRDLTLSEYSDLSGFSGFEYYRKWSVKYGSSPMNYIFWNNILKKG